MIEIDNVLRGEKCFNKKLMTHALYDLISWTFISNSIKKLYLRVFSNNQRAIDYYENLNFVIKEQIPLKQNTDDSGNKTYYQAKKGEKQKTIFHTWSCLETSF